MASAQDSARHYAKNKVAIQARRRRARQLDRAGAIVTDCRKADRRRGLTCDLDREFVVAALAGGCTYCGEQEIRMTLDRKDNAAGHTKANVVAACERCNFIRRDMPYDAWLVVAVAVKQARAAGLFGAWTCGIHGRKPIEAAPAKAVRVVPPHGTTARYKRCGPPPCAACKRAHREWKSTRRAEKRRGTQGQLF